MLIKLAKSIVSICCVFILLLGSFFSVSAFSQASTNTSLDITSNGLVIGPFEVNPETIFVGDSLIFTFFDIRYGNGDFAVGLICNMTLTAPDGTIVELETLVSDNGTCSYDTSMSLLDQNITLISGDINLLNTTAGNGEGFAVVNFNGSDFISNTDTYQVLNVESLELENPVFEIIPENIFVFDELRFNLTGARFTNGDIASDLPCKHFLSPPDNQPLVELSGITNDQGECNFTLDKRTATILNKINVNAQQSYTVDIGDTIDLHDRIGSGSGYGEVYYNNVAYRSNLDNYNVSQEDIIEVIIRTGGEYSYVIILALVGLISFGVYISLKNKE